MCKILKSYRNESQKVNIEEKEVGDIVFIQQKEESFINPKYLSFKNYFEILGLEEFVKTNDISQDLLDKILLHNEDEFVFLKELNYIVDGMVSLLKSQGALSVGIVFVNDILYQKQQSI